MRTAGSIFLVFTGLLCLLLLLPSPGEAAWPTDPLVNVPICVAAGAQRSPAVVADTLGGAIIAWVDSRAGAGNEDLYAQRVSAGGALRWTVDGVAVCSAGGVQSDPVSVPDGAGGAIVAWSDERYGSNGDIYAQRISPDGTPLWTADGVPVCTAAGDQSRPMIVSDGAGGAIVAWFGDNGGGNICAQRISAAGSVLWTADGVALRTSGGGMEHPSIATDGKSGAIVAWEDPRSAIYYDIYARRVASNGFVGWTPGGVPVCTAAYEQRYPVIVSDGASGAIVCWYDIRGGIRYDLYAQRVAFNGVTQWTSGGVLVCASLSAQPSAPAMIPDGAGGALITWYGTSSSSTCDIYCQRLSAAGALQWAPAGVLLCASSGDQYVPKIVPDGAGGAIVAWSDGRSGGSDIHFDLYAQRVAIDGGIQWASDGVPLTTALGATTFAIASDGAGGAIAAWADERGGDSDIFAQRVQGNGQLGGEAVSVPPPTPALFGLDPVRPNPSSGGALTAQFTLASAAAASLELLDVAGRRILARDVGSLGAGRHAVDLAEGARLAPGLYLLLLRQGESSRVTRVAVLR